MDTKKHNYGQYFTTNNELKTKVYEFILNNPTNILEPSIGQGDLINFIMEKNPKITFDMYEIDKNIKLKGNILKKNVIYGDFLKQNINKTYKTIIGNPPYVRTKKGNLYIDFIEKCYDLLDDNGELIFIVPSDFLKLTSASKILNKMITTGSFTHIFHPHNEKMFENACIDVLIFRYYKNNNINKKVLYNDKELFVSNSNGLITFTDNDNNNNNTFLIKDYFDVFVGLVSGKEDVFKNSDFGNIKVLNGEKKLDKYIFIENFPCDDDNINNYLLSHKKILTDRKIKKFNEKNWFEWGAPRNINIINNNLNKECIYIYNLTRKTNISFVDKVNYFGGGLIMLIPKKKCDLHKIVSFFNSDTFKNNFIFSGRFKIGHRQLCNSYIPSDIL